MSQFDSPRIHPNCVKFVKDLYENFRRRDIFRLEDQYTYDWHQLTESYFKNTPWPTWDEARLVLEDELEDGEPFIHVYQELYFRHLFERCQPTVEDMFDSFGNYLQLMNAILSLDVCAPDFELPPTWLWDVIENFVLQFNRFHNFRHSAQNLDPDSLQLLRDHEHVWSAQTMTRYLQVLVKKSGIDYDMTPEKYLQMLEQQKEADPQPSIFFRFLGQFSSVGLLVTHCLLGDYYSALEALKLFDINSRQNTWFEVLDVYACIAYHVGWANMMLRRYTEAVRTITQFLQVVGLDPNNRVHLGPQAKVHVNHMYGVLRLCQAFVPRQKVDDSIGGAVSDVVNETLEAYAATSGTDPRSLTDPQVVAIVFSSLGPDFVDTTTPKFLRPAGEEESPAAAESSDPEKDEEEEESSEFGLVEVPGLLESAPQKLQRKNFTKELESRRALETAETCLRLCTTVSTTELAKFLQTTEEEVERLLVALKHKRFEKIREEWLERSSTIRFHVEDDVVHVAEQAYRRLDHKPLFTRHIINLENLMTRVRSIGMPRM